MRSSPRTLRLDLLCFSLLACLTADQIQAQDAPTKTQSPEAARTEFFNSTKVHQMHLEISASEWEAMQEVVSSRARQKAAEQSTPPNGEKRPLHKGKFPWAIATVTIGDKVLKGVGVRYKGNASFALSRGNLKRNLKLKFDWTDEDQRYSHIKTLNLNAGGLDPSRIREALSYATFQAAGIPAPRTSYAEVTLTVPGKHDKAHLGLYTLVEQVNKSFLRNRFGSSKGLLLKPERIESVNYLGEDWEDYVDRYHPDDEPTVSQSKRVIAFARLVNESDDEQFQEEIGSYLDVEGYLNYIAINVLLVNLDSLPVMGQNYYLYLHPESDKFIFFPWDLDLSLAGWPLGGPPPKQVDLSLFRPHAGKCKLLDRLLAIEEWKARYEGIFRTLAAGNFAKARLLRDLEMLEKAVEKPLEREVAATRSRNEPGYRSPTRGFRPPEPRSFIEDRTSSIESQLTGKNEGYTYTERKPSFGRRQTAIHILVQGDTNKDRTLSKEELVNLGSQWFDTMDKDKTGKLDQARFIASLPDALFPPGFPHSRPEGVKIPEDYVAIGLFAAADSDKDGLATKESLTTTLDKWFTAWDSDKEGALGGRSLYEGLKKVISMNPPPRSSPK